MPAVRRPPGISALSAFFVFGAAMSGSAAISLAFPGGVLEPMWRLNPRGRAGLGALGWPGILLMAVVAAACLAAAIGLWRGRRWGARLAAAILVVNCAGDLLNGLVGHDPRTLIGVPIVAALLFYLRTDRVREFFAAERR